MEYIKNKNNAEDRTHSHAKTTEYNRSYLSKSIEMKTESQCIIFGLPGYNLKTENGSATLPSCRQRSPLRLKSSAELIKLLYF